MKKLAIALIAGLLSTTGIAAAADKTVDPIEVASLSSASQKTGWLQVLSGGKPVKSNAKIAAVSRAPIARELVAFNEDVVPGTIIVDNSERRLYHVLGSGLAMKYAVSVGREGFIWTGTEKVTRKTEWPTWTPPEDMRAREAKKGKVLPVTMKGGRVGAEGRDGAEYVVIGAEGVVHLPTHLAAEWPQGTLVRIEPEDVDRLVVSRPRDTNEEIA